MQICENHSLEALKCVINPETARILQQMIRIKLQENEPFDINDILDFFGTVENGNKNCIWSTTVGLPREISVLDYTSQKMTATNELAVNISKLTTSGTSK